MDAGLNGHTTRNVMPRDAPAVSTAPTATKAKPTTGADPCGVPQGTTGTTNPSIPSLRTQSSTIRTTFGAICAKTEIRSPTRTAGEEKSPHVPRLQHGVGRICTIASSGPWAGARLVQNDVTPSGTAIGARSLQRSGASNRHAPMAIGRASGTPEPI